MVFIDECTKIDLDKIKQLSVREKPVSLITEYRTYSVPKKLKIIISKNG